MQGKKIKEIGEFGLIDQLLSRSKQTWPKGVVGPGDDCGVVPLGDDSWEVVTVDALVEQRHFTLRHFQPFEIGWKAMATTLSDIAAMGATPRYVVVNLQLKQDLEVEWVEEVYRGIFQILDDFQVWLLGGNITAGEENSIVTTAVGKTVGKSPILRSGAKVGDQVWVSGVIGEAAAGFWVLNDKISRKEIADQGMLVCKKQKLPQPRILLGQELLRSGFVNSLIDLSDGLLQDAGHICQASDLSIELNLNDIPLTNIVGVESFSLIEALCGGEDYELFFTAPAAAEQQLIKISEKQLGTTIRKIGVVTEKKAGRGVYLNDGHNLTSAEDFVQRDSLGSSLMGYQHFYNDNLKTSLPKN